MTRSLRVVALLRVFVNGASLTAEEVAERYGCSLGAAQRDVQALKTAGWIVSQLDEAGGRRARYAVNPRYQAARDSLATELEAFNQTGGQ